jgi:hypothetical protein
LVWLNFKHRQELFLLQEADLEYGAGDAAGQRDRGLHRRLFGLFENEFLPEQEASEGRDKEEES